MIHSRSRVLLTILLALAVLPFTARAGEAAASTGSPDNLLVYLDCNVCNRQYIQTTIPFVTYVRDQADASLYLEVEVQRTATGWEYVLLFNPSGSSRVDSLVFTLLDTQTPDERRAELSRRMRLGLIPYLLQTGAAESLGEFETLTAYSLSKHFSLGMSAEMGYSTFRNQSFYMRLSPALEYNVFPYEEYQNRRFLFVYRLSPALRRYDETTIYGLDRQTMVQQSLSANLRYIQRWGRLETRISGSHLLHDFSQNRINFDSGVDVRIARGLSLNMSARYSLINDQYSLPAGQVDDQDSLLNLRQQATSYSYGMSFGFSYSFGSIYTSVVNPRL